MDDFKVIFTDNDGDGIYDDHQLVTVMEEPSSPTQKTYYHHEEPTRTSYTPDVKLVSTKTKVKILIAICCIALGISALTYIGLGIISLFI